MERSRPNKVVLTMSMESLIDDNVMDALKMLFGDRLSTLDHNQLLALALAYTEEEISNERLQYALEMHKADISQMLGEMSKQQFLEPSGRGRGTTYHVYGVEMPQMGKVATSDDNIALNMDSSMSNMDSSKSNISEKKSDVDTPKSNISEKKSNIDTPKSNISEKESGIDTSKSNISTKKYYKKDELVKLIVDFCQNWKTIDEIAIYLGRDAKYIKNMVLPKMSNLIEKMYNIPHHPRQKYRAKQRVADE